MTPDDVTRCDKQEFTKKECSKLQGGSQKTNKWQNKKQM